MKVLRINTRTFGRVGISLGRDGFWMVGDRFGFVMFTPGSKLSAKKFTDGRIVRLPLFVALLLKLVREHAPRQRDWVALCADTDCDGTTYWASRLAGAWTLNRAARMSDPQYFGEVVTERTFRRMLGAGEFRIDEPDPDFQWRQSGYLSLGANWNPWVYDDTIGIPALDHTAEDGLYD